MYTHKGQNVLCVYTAYIMYCIGMSIYAHIIIRTLVEYICYAHTSDLLYV